MRSDEGEERGFQLIQTLDFVPVVTHISCKPDHPAMENRAFSKEELRHFNGKNGAPAYVAFQGKVYDVSKSFLWLGGRHWVFHNAGADLTDELVAAPHGSDMLDRFPVVGLLLP